MELVSIHLIQTTDDTGARVEVAPNTRFNAKPSDAEYLVSSGAAKKYAEADYVPAEATTPVKGKGKTKPAEDDI